MNLNQSDFDSDFDTLLMESGDGDNRTEVFKTEITPIEVKSNKKFAPSTTGRGRGRRAKKISAINLDALLGELPPIPEAQTFSISTNINKTAAETKPQDKIQNEEKLPSILSVSGQSNLLTNLDKYIDSSLKSLRTEIISYVEQLIEETFSYQKYFDSFMKDIKSSIRYIFQEVQEPMNIDLNIENQMHQFKDVFVKSSQTKSFSSHHWTDTVHAHIEAANDLIQAGLSSKFSELRNLINELEDIQTTEIRNDAKRRQLQFKRKSFILKGEAYLISSELELKYIQDRLNRLENTSNLSEESIESITNEEPNFWREMRLLQRVIDESSRKTRTILSSISSQIGDEVRFLCGSANDVSSEALTLSDLCNVSTYATYSSLMMGGEPEMYEEDDDIIDYYSPPKRERKKRHRNAFETPVASPGSPYGNQTSASNSLLSETSGVAQYAADFLRAHLIEELRNIRAQNSRP